ncbi:MAG: biotin/lipoyl-binding protein [Acidobacteriaceae bacterium]|nr:biotin/lipoyl-binding protein [Acidobacteriaceae bacterium]MBV8573346.1 biotin/lipoyl-binding protein [Acidobacteriaceae bacterium]
MATRTAHNVRKLTARALGIGIVAGALVTGLIVWWETNTYPRTDDSWVTANLIGIAPEVNGPIQRLYVRDNQFVKAGDLLYQIDPRPYEYALERARSEQVTLEKQILNEERVIAGQHSAVNTAEATVSTSEANVNAAQANILASEAAVLKAEAALASAKAQASLANDTLHRYEPLLAKQFVTVEDIDRARTNDRTGAESVRQATSELAVARAQLEASKAQHVQATAVVSQSQSRLQESIHNVTLLDPLLAQRGERAAAVKTAEYDLSRCRVFAPFDARVTDLTISEGAYAHVGQQVFTLIDVRRWWAVGNFRESQLKAIRPGMRADIYVMTRPTQRFTGVVESASFGVTPQNVTVGQGLPDVQRSLNWVHLASRYPVRVLVDHPDQELFRIGGSAVVIVRGNGRIAAR